MGIGVVVVGEVGVVIVVVVVVRRQYALAPVVAMVVDFETRFSSMRLVGAVVDRCELRWWSIVMIGALTMLYGGDWVMWGCAR